MYGRTKENKKFNVGKARNEVMVVAASSRWGFKIFGIEISNFGAVISVTRSMV
jgi:hypothetical protein